MKTINIIDQGRGMQLSNSRITVQDVYPYLKDKCAREEILEHMPTLSLEELLVIEAYVDSHIQQMQEVDRQIEARNLARSKPEDQINKEREDRLLRLRSARQSIIQATREKACDPVAG